MKKYFLLIAGISLLGVGFYTKVFIPKHTFTTLQLQKVSVNTSVDGIGNVDVENIYKIGSLYGGKVTTFNLKEGEFVKKGELVATIDSVDLKDKLQELQATINKISQDIIALKVDKKSAVVQAKYQENILKKNENLYKKRAISELDFEKFVTNSKVAQLKIETLSAKIDALYAQKKQVLASVSGLKERLKRYSITAPIDGYVTKKYISNFSIVMPNQPLVDIVNPKDVWVATFIDTRVSAKVKIGDIAKISLRSQGKVYEGVVKSIKPINNKVTYEREIDIAFSKLPIPFYLQEQASVKIMVEHLENVYKVPTKVLSYYHQKEGVWIVQNNIVFFKEIDIIAHGENYVVTKSLKRDDEIVVPNPKKKTLQEGMKIYHD